MKCVIVIPARSDSKRFPGKLLEVVDGRTILEHTVRNARRCIFAMSSEYVVVAAADTRIYDIADSFRDEKNLPLCRVEQTEMVHNCGTSRVAEIIRSRYGVAEKDDTVVNLQADEPTITGPDLDRLISEHEKHKPAVTTMSYDEKGGVRVVTDKVGTAQWFSRCDLPGSQRHAGVYVFHRESILALSFLRCEAERAESLEQLAWLYDGAQINVVHSEGFHAQIDDEVGLQYFMDMLDARKEAEAENHG